MGTRDRRVDAYIARSAAFAHPILKSLRAHMHQACPAVQETLKWGHPSFQYHGILAGMAAFQAHCVFGFWKHEVIVKDSKRARQAMGCFGRITKASDLPSKPAFTRFVVHAMKLNEQGVKAVRSKTRPRVPVAMHPQFKLALSKKKKAKQFLDQLSPSQQRDYLEWIAEAKQDATRARRITQAVAWLAHGKPHNWKYM